MSKTHPLLMVILGLVFVPMMCVNVLNEIAALMLLRGPDFLSVFDKRQQEAIAMLFLDLPRYGYTVGRIFGLWLSPLVFLYFDRVSFPAP